MREEWRRKKKCNMTKAELRARSAERFASRVKARRERGHNPNLNMSETVEAFRPGFSVDEIKRIEARSR